MKKLGREEKEKLVQIMREYEEWCEVQVLTCYIMANHSHFLVEVRERPEVFVSRRGIAAETERADQPRRLRVV